MEVIKMIKISKDFSETPGARYISDGPNSGEQFYNEILKNSFGIAMSKNGLLEIDFDDSFGYASSFLSEAFSRLTKEFGKDKVLKYLKLKSEDEPLLVNEVKNIINKVS